MLPCSRPFFVNQEAQSFETLLIEKKRASYTLTLSVLIDKPALCPITEQENGYFRQYLGRDQRDNQFFVIKI